MQEPLNPILAFSDTKAVVAKQLAGIGVTAFPVVSSLLNGDLSGVTDRLCDRWPPPRISLFADAGAE